MTLRELVYNSVELELNASLKRVAMNSCISILDGYYEVNNALYEPVAVAINDNMSSHINNISFRVALDFKSLD